MTVTRNHFGGLFEEGFPWPSTRFGCETAQPFQQLEPYKLAGVQQFLPGTVTS